jgi:hypothetical protein
MTHIPTLEQAVAEMFPLQDLGRQIYVLLLVVTDDRKTYRFIPFSMLVNFLLTIPLSLDFLGPYLAHMV